MNSMDSFDEVPESPQHGGQEQGEDLRYYRPARSDILVHWTGNPGIDDVHDPGWMTDHSSQTDEEVTHLYLERLRSILRHGLWMNDETELTHTARGVTWDLAPHARTCFTELRLSHVRSHAARYGRLGIGFKRPFLYQRLGAPVIYYQPRWFPNWCLPPLLPEGNLRFSGCFHKPMAVKTPDSTTYYRYYDEAEWRIIYSEEMKRQLLNSDVPDHRRVPELFESSDALPQEAKPHYLIPVKSKWFAMIIFPSLQAKVVAKADPDIQALIDDMKPVADDVSLHQYFQQTPLNPAPLEQNSEPITLDLDTCRNL